MTRLKIIKVKKQKKKQKKELSVSDNIDVGPKQVMAVWKQELSPDEQK